MEVYIDIPEEGQWSTAHWKICSKPNDDTNVWLKNQDTHGYISIRSNEKWSFGEGVAWTRNQNKDPTMQSSWERLRIETLINNNSFKLEVLPSTFSTEFKCLLNNRDSHPDVIFEVGNEEYCAHKCILIARSQYFYGLFNRGLRESRQEKIIIKDIKPKTFFSILHFIYTDDVSIMETASLQELLDSWTASNLYGLFRMKSLLESIFSGQLINSENAIPCILALENLPSHSRENLFSICIDYIKKHKPKEGWPEEKLSELNQETRRLLSINQMSLYHGEIH